MQKNASLLAIVAVHTAENEASKGHALQRVVRAGLRQHPRRGRVVGLEEVPMMVS